MAAKQNYAPHPHTSTSLLNQHGKEQIVYKLDRDSRDYDLWILVTQQLAHSLSLCPDKDERGIHLL